MIWINWGFVTDQGLTAYGPLALKRYYDTARFMGMKIAMHSAYELGPGTAIRLHIAAFAFPYTIRYHIVWGNGIAPFALHGIDAHYNQAKKNTSSTNATSTPSAPTT